MILSADVKIVAGDPPVDAVMVGDEGFVPFDRPFEDLRCRLHALWLVLMDMHIGDRVELEGRRACWGVRWGVRCGVRIGVCCGVNDV